MLWFVVLWFVVFRFTACWLVVYDVWFVIRMLWHAVLRFFVFGGLTL